MVHLTLAGLSEDGRRLLLVSDAGVEFTLDVDARLRAALRGDRNRLGQLEITMDSALRPRDIQTRIRAGESPEAVAEASGATIEKIMPYAGPVMAERQHMAERAQRSSLRRPAGDHGARTLGEAVAVRLSPDGLTADVVEWDAWRRPDGRWALRGEYSTPRRSGGAEFTYDMPGNYVTCDNDDARWLVGELDDQPAPGLHADDLQRARDRRAVVSADELPLGQDVLEIVAEAPARPAPEPVAAESAPVAEPVEPVEPEEPAGRKPKKRGRASVPSWDEIMFGGGTD
ncbi:septation protein SepH [Nocardioides limicola]|uniref:septation protein SepH n=1 Tax=Nocardioides limicola TaxID=2803368 RepID=UPI00193BDDB1|nr:septation protein SepH [Nocardioides sp. DJM-14]